MLTLRFLATTLKNGLWLYLNFFFRHRFSIRFPRLIRFLRFIWFFRNISPYMIRIFTSAHILLDLVLLLNRMPAPLQILRLVTTKHKSRSICTHNAVLLFHSSAKLQPTIGFLRHFIRLPFPPFSALLAGIALHGATLIVQGKLGFVHSIRIVLLCWQTTFAWSMHGVDDAHVAVDVCVSLGSIDLGLHSLYLFHLFYIFN